MHSQRRYGIHQKWSQLIRTKVKLVEDRDTVLVPKKVPEKRTSIETTGSWCCSKGMPLVASNKRHFVLHDRRSSWELHSDFWDSCSETMTYMHICISHKNTVPTDRSFRAESTCKVSNKIRSAETDQIFLLSLNCVSSLHHLSFSGSKSREDNKWFSERGLGPERTEGWRVSWDTIRQRFQFTCNPSQIEYCQNEEIAGQGWETLQ